jgi:alpha-tubulin suppressor-like RCC1 family protein
VRANLLRTKIIDITGHYMLFRFLAVFALLLPLLANAASLEAGGNHNCALTDMGGVQCWGANGSGQLGDGTVVDRLTPVAVSGLSSGVLSIAMGEMHSCGLTAVGGVQCWGRNNYGQLGDGTTIDRLTPVAVTGLSSGVQIIVAGAYFTCALMTAGDIRCWGINNFGQLGDGTITDRLTPVELSGLDSVQAIAAGSYHSCALTNAGGVVCWGNNARGQLGDGTATNRLTPVAVSGLGSGVQMIASIARHSCALTTAGALQCWGNNSKGQLGDGTTTNRLTPVAVSGLSNDVQAITGGGDHSCALTNGGGVQCWGDNARGQLGDGTTTDRLTPVGVSGLSSGVQAVTAGNVHSCALTNAGGVQCWGWNLQGQLGDGTTTAKLLPVSVVEPDGDNDGVPDIWDAFPLDNNESVDTDSDGLGDNADVDDDNDGVDDWDDNCSFVSNPDQLDADSDGIGNACDTTPNGDTDNDGIDNLTDNCVSISNTNQLNTDGDAQGNACDNDDDNDGVADVSDAFPLDATESADTDSDGIGNNTDNCVSVSNTDQLNTDGDAQGDVCDNDDDNDGVADVSDAFPLDATESVDTDSDGIGDNADTTPNGDTDNDGIDNAADNCPLIANSNQLDYDANNIGDACDDPVPVPEDVAGVMKNAKAGSAVAFAGDVNGDGYGDYVVGMPGYDIPAAPPVKIIKDAGRAEVISGKTGAVLMSVNGVAAKDAMGFAVAGNGDIDNDGFDDVVVGAPTADDTESGIKDTGSAILLYGPNGERRQTFFGTEPKSQFGYAFSVADANSDGHADILIGAPKDNDMWPHSKKVGSVSLFSGENNSLLVKWYGGTSGWGYGSSVLLADLDADGVAEIVVGSPYATYSNSSSSGDGDSTGAVMASSWRNEYPRAGKVSVYGLAEGYWLWSTGIYKKNALFGSSLAVADVNADGENELIVGAPGYAGINYEGNKAAGSVSVISGDVGFEMGRFFGESKKTGLGLVVSAGDVNGDGYDDIIAGTKLDDNSGAKIIKDTGSVSVWSGNDYSLITTLYGEKKGDLFGAAVSAGDINSDGKADLIIGIPGFDALPILPATKPMKDTGAVRVLSGGDL